MGVTRSGRMALVTNVRGGAAPPPAAVSRGTLVSGFLLRSDSPQAYAAEVHQDGQRYAGFNLLCGYWKDLVFVSNRAPAPIRVSPGFHGLSNGLLDEPWPKVVRGKALLAASISASDVVESLLDVLHDDTLGLDAALPDTGVGIELERMLSPMFIHGETYGTRASTVLVMRPDGHVSFGERSYDKAGPTGTVRFDFDVRGDM
jgi:uncharacterized protein with NRDE domain